MTAEVERRFKLANLDDVSEEAWGPSTIPEKFKDIPYYSPYNKGDKLGKAADWQQQAYPGKSRGFQKQGATGDGREGVNTIFNWYYTDDDNSFQLVDNTKITTKRYGSGARRFQNRGFQNLRQHRGQQNWAQNSRQQKQQPRKHQQLNRYNQYQNPNYVKWGQGTPQRKKEHSVEIKSDWKLVEEIEFVRLNKLNLDTEPQPEDLKSCGSLEAYDKQYDRITSRNEKPLERSNRPFYNPTTSDDPIIKELADKGNVFATAGIITHLMACTRSVAPWDLIVTKSGDNIYFDKRDGSIFDVVTVSETALEPPSDDGSLSREATFINQMFSEQVRKKDKPAQTFDNPHPFHTDSNLPPAAVGYKYRRFQLGDNKLVVRCEIDGISDNNYLTVKALNEHDLKTSDWKKTIDSQRGALLATELKNNSMKLAKWTAQALLAGTYSFKLGWVSRASPKDNYNHIILGAQDYKPKEFATQINLNFKNSWAVLKYFIDLLKKQPNGKYVLMRDTERHILFLYSIPDGSAPVPASQEKPKEEAKPEVKA